MTGRNDERTRRKQYGPSTFFKVVFFFLGGGGGLRERAKQNASFQSGVMLLSHFNMTDRSRKLFQL